MSFMNDCSAPVPLEGYGIGFDDGFSAGKAAGTADGRAKTLAENRDFNPQIHVEWSTETDRNDKLVIKSVRVWSEDPRVAKFSYAYTPSLRMMYGAEDGSGFLESGTRDFTLSNPVTASTMMILAVAHTADGLRSPLFIARMYNGNTIDTMFGTIS